MTSQLDTLTGEHRSIRAVLDGMRYLLREKRARFAAVDNRVFGAMLYYLDVFGERVHHPREESILFEALRHRSAAIDEVVEELAREHEGGESAIRAVEQAFVRFLEGGAAEFAGFAGKAERYVEQYLEHMRKEEELLLPYAREVLGAADWAAIEASYAESKDPLSGVDHTDYRALFSRIAELAPPPIGLGPVPSGHDRRLRLG